MFDFIWYGAIYTATGIVALGCFCLTLFIILGIVVHLYERYVEKPREARREAVRNARRKRWVREGIDPDNPLEGMVERLEKAVEDMEYKEKMRKLRRKAERREFMTQGEKEDLARFMGFEKVAGTDRWVAKES